MTHNRIAARLLPMALPLALTALALAAIPAAAAPTAHAASTTWREVAQISVRSADVGMVGVGALTPDDAWALAEVGYHSGSVKPLVQHWNGVRWRQVTIPARIVNSFDSTDLWDSFGVSRDGTLWAFAFNGHYLTMTDGRWSAGELPGNADAEAVTVFSRTNVWVFGSRVVGDDFNFKFLPYAAHFDGRTWTAVPVPGTSDISGVSAISPRDIYAVTGRLDSATPRVLHWDGSTWRFLPVQPSVTRLTTIYSILALKHSRLYIGGSVPAGKKTSAALVEQWNGRSWTNITPAPAGPSAFTLSLARAPDCGIWAMVVSTNFGTEQIYHRAGGTWSAPAPVPWFLNELAAIPHTASTWASGTVKIRGQYRGVIALHGPVPSREG